MEVSKTIAERIRARLKDLGWKHHDLARELGIERATVTQTLKGRNIKVDTLLLWADKLSVTPYWLMGIDEKSQPPPKKSLRDLKLEAIDIILGITNEGELGALLAGLTRHSSSGNKRKASL
jgi:transcriptional regulator with XRE-family HTH domain